ncbi:hypothetical protein [Paenibacillus sp. OSY-SE]|uniref:hypothetical protein n=1 Tax=Paenibacillus sp. OSY-SE TaxID=1196323 RepID=UPI0002D3D727|nr:hypothetical protein [Paenibacillus sp. OSY-SE]
MSWNKLEGIDFKRENRSYIDALHAILTAAGRFAGTKSMLSGMTGMAFKFIIHEYLSESSMTAYGYWGKEHGEAAERLGWANVSPAGYIRHPTFPLARKQAERSIKLSIDRGLGVVFWLPEFAVIHGYDDEDEVYFYRDGWSQDEQVMLYDNFGVAGNGTPFWFYQLLLDKWDRPEADIYRESLRAAVSEWETPHKTAPDQAFASGRPAYDYLIQALESRRYSASGGTYILKSYAGIKRDIVAYLEAIQAELGLTEAVLQAYREVDAVYRHICRFIRADEGTAALDQASFPALLKSVREAKELEEKAVHELKACIGCEDRLPGELDIALWGIASPR